MESHPEQAKAQMRNIFPTLKRWKEKDKRSLAEKAVSLLAQCNEVTLATINADGFPRPSPSRKLRPTDATRFGWQPMPHP